MKAFALIPMLLSVVLLSACGSGSQEGSTTAPSVFAGDDINVVEKNEFTVTAKGSPAEGTFLWQRVSGPTVEWTTLEGAEQTITAPDVKADSELVLRVTYETLSGGLVSDDVSIFIVSNNLLPLAVVTQTAPDTLPSVYDNTITLSAADSSDPDENGQIDSYLWKLNDYSWEPSSYSWQENLTIDLDIDSLTNSTLSFSHPLLENNINLNWSLTVTDDEGGVSTTTYDMTLNKTEESLIANAGADQVVNEFDEVTLDATNSNAATLQYTCQWQQLSGNAEVIINPDKCIATFLASDVDTINQLKFEVTITDLKGDTSSDDVFIDVTPKSLGLINDTGMDKCFDNIQQIACDNDDFPRQDADVGRDSFAGQLNKAGKGNLAFDYTKLNEYADEVDDTSTTFSCIRDNLTGLVWEVKSPVSGTVPFTLLRDGQNHYTGYLGGASGASSSSTCPSATNCDLQTYVDEVNALDFCGGTNWRVPTYTELLSLIDYSKQGTDVLIDKSFFPNTPSKTKLGHLRYWTSQTAADGTSLSQSYIIDMSDGNDLAYPKDSTAYVRLVRER